MKRTCLLLVLSGLILQVSGTLFAQIPAAGRDILPPESPLRNPGADVFVTVLDAEDGKPIANATLTYSDRHDAPTFTSDANGVVRIDHEKIQSFTLWASSFWITAPGHGDFYHNWDDAAESADRNSVKIENQYIVRMTRHTHLQGLVLDEQKQPIENATVTISYRPFAPQLTKGGETLPSDDQKHTATVQTDQNGRWLCNTIPGDVAIESIVPSHPDYAKSFSGGGVGPQTVESSMFYGNRALRSRFMPDYTQTLRRGTDIVLRVTDEQGRPVAGASVIDASQFGNRDADVFITGNDGAVKLSHYGRGQRHFVVKANGYAPQGERINVTETPETFTFSIQRGRKLTLRVVDPNGRPVPGAEVTLRTEEPLPYSAPWYGDDIPRHTDANGIWVWEHAPQKEGSLNVMKDGYVHGGDVPVEANVGEYSHVLYETFVVKGRVVDAETKQPIERFNAILVYEPRPGYGKSFAFDSLPTQVYIERIHQTPRDYPDGQFVWRWPQTFDNLCVRIIAPGYEMADSPTVRMGDDNPTFDFALKRNPNITGSVTTGDGQPAAGVEIAVGSKGNPIYVHNGRIDRQKTKVVVTSDQQGRFAFPAVEGQYTLVAMSGRGYAIVRWDDFQFRRDLVLRHFAPQKFSGTIPNGRTDTLTFGKGGQETLDGYFIDISYDLEADPTATYRIMSDDMGQLYFSHRGDKTILNIPLR